MLRGSQMKTFKFKDKEEKEICVYKWDTVESKIKGVVQIAHGMTETALRYDYFANALNKEGYIVYANDHRGHGSTAISKEELGYIADEDGFNWMVTDLAEITKIIKLEYENVPVILFGHSMGSFLCQSYVQQHKNNVDKLILSGTNGKPKVITKLGLLIAECEMKIRGRRHISSVMDKLSFGSFNRSFKPCRTQYDWLCSNEEAVDEYISNELCGFICTTSFYYDLINGLWNIHKKENLSRINKDLPIFIFSGAMDPVGYFGKGIINLYNTYKGEDIKDVSYKLYTNGRHEMINEKNRDEVISDIIKWIEKA